MRARGSASQPDHRAVTPPATEGHAARQPCLSRGERRARLYIQPMTTRSPSWGLRGTPPAASSRPRSRRRAAPHRCPRGAPGRSPSEKRCNRHGWVISRALWPDNPCASLGTGIVSTQALLFVLLRTAPWVLQCPQPAGSSVPKGVRHNNEMHLTRSALAFASAALAGDLGVGRTS